MKGISMEKKSEFNDHKDRATSVVVKYNYDNDSYAKTYYVPNDYDYLDIISVMRDTVTIKARKFSDANESKVIAIFGIPHLISIEPVYPEY